MATKHIIKVPLQIDGKEKDAIKLRYDKSVSTVGDFEKKYVEKHYSDWRLPLIKKPDLIFYLNFKSLPENR